MPALQLEAQDHRPRALDDGGLWDGSTRTLHCTHNAGFFSNCTVALWNLAEVVRRELVWPERIDFSRAFGSYRDAAQMREQTDLYPVFFESGPAIANPPRALPRVNHHGLYARLPWRELQPVLERYFRPSTAARDAQAAWVQRHGIDPARTIAVVYRGTDKGTEVRLANPVDYLERAKGLLATRPEHRVWIQTDEAAVRGWFLDALGDRCFHIDEMPVSASGRVVHALDDHTLGLSRSRSGVLLVAATHLLSQVDIVVNHTGNMALWIALWRGHARGLFQFDDAGQWVDLRSPIFHARRLTHLGRRAGRRWLRIATP